MGQITRRQFAGATAVALTAAGVYGRFPLAAQDASPEPASGYGAVASGDGNEFVVTHAQGETTVPANPERVITFDLASLDILDTLGVAVIGTAKGSLSGYLETYDSDDYINAGTLFEPDYEAVAGADADLIIVANRSSTVYPELSDIATTIDLTAAEGADHLEVLHTNATILGELFGKQADVETALTAIDARVETLKATAANAGTGLVIMTVGGEVSIIAATGAAGNRGSIIYRTLGIQPPIDDIEEATHGEAVSFEFLLETNPDWLFVIDRDSATGEASDTAEQILDNEIVHQTTAWQQGHVVYLDPFSWYIVMNGLTATNRMLDDVEAGFAAAG